MEIILPIISRNEITSNIDGVLIGSVNITPHNYIKAIASTEVDDDDNIIKRFTTLYLTTDIVEIDMNLVDFLYIKQDENSYIRVSESKAFNEADSYLYNKIKDNYKRL